MKAVTIILPLLVLLAASTTVLAGQGPEPSEMETEILAVLRAAETGWNAGDLGAYMNSYWRSEELRFAGGDRASFGWEKVLSGYRKRYPDRAAMGKLTFSELDVTLLGPDAALVFGRWRLDREGDEPGEVPKGLFTLLLRRLPEGWRIVHDHTSSG
ncbi:MAG: nuclear transport factor 2 family protein [Gemmatimonadales bacterium]|nr:nuclear transport factor 2 family protein [Gemmatimonadales bacterium]